MQKDLSGSVKGRSFSFFFKCNLNCLCTPKLVDSRSVWRRGEMEESWAGSCKVSGLHSWCVNGKQGVARAEDQAIWEEILVQSHCGGESQSCKRGRPSLRACGGSSRSERNEMGSGELPPAATQVISSVRAGILVLQLLEKGGNHTCQTLPRPQGAVRVVARQGTAGLGQTWLLEPSSNLQPSRGGAVLGRTVVRAGVMSLQVRTSCPSPDPELPACLQQACT